MENTNNMPEMHKKMSGGATLKVLLGALVVAVVGVAAYIVVGGGLFEGALFGPNVKLTVDTNTIAENGGMAIFTVELVNREGPKRVCVTVTGNNFEVNPANKCVNIPSDTSTGAFTLTSNDDGNPINGDTSLTVALKPGQYTPVDPSSQTITVIESGEGAQNSLTLTSAKESITEGPSFNHKTTITAKLDKAPGFRKTLEIPISWDKCGEGEAAAATKGEDFSAVPANSKITIRGLSKTGTLTVEGNYDVLAENESAYFSVSDQTQSDLVLNGVSTSGDLCGSVKIEDAVTNGYQATLTADKTEVKEGENLKVTVTLDKNVGEFGGMNLLMKIEGVQVGDYTAIPANKKIQIARGQNSGELNILVKTDGQAEAGESVKVSTVDQTAVPSNVLEVPVVDQTPTTVTFNKGTLPVLSEEGATSKPFEVRLDKNVSVDTLVPIVFTGTGAVPAVSGAYDVTGCAFAANTTAGAGNGSCNVTIAAGTKTAEVKVTAKDNGIYESGDQTFEVTFDEASLPPLMEVGTRFNKVTGSIKETRIPVTLSVDKQELNFGETATFTCTLAVGAPAVSTNLDVKITFTGADGVYVPDGLIPVKKCRINSGATSGAFTVLSSAHHVMDKNLNVTPASVSGNAHYVPEDAGYPLVIKLNGSL